MEIFQTDWLFQGSTEHETHRSICLFIAGSFISKMLTAANYHRKFPYDEQNFRKQSQTK